MIIEPVSIALLVLDVLVLVVFFLLFSRDKLVFKPCDHKHTFTYINNKKTKVSCMCCCKTLKNEKNENLPFQS